MSGSAISCVFAIILSFYGITCHHNQQIRITIGNDDDQTFWNQVGFTACHTLNATYPVNATVIYNKVISNAGDAYDPRNGEFEAPVLGLYSFTFTGMAYQSTTMYLYLMMDDNYIVQIYSNNGSADSATNTANLYLNNGDKVRIMVGRIPGHLHTSDYNCFSGLRVR